MLTEDQWAEIAIVSNVRTELDTGEPMATISLAPGRKCVRCWRMLEEVGEQPNHPTLCARCADAVEFRTGLPRVMVRTPPPNPLPQGEGEQAARHSPSACGRGLGGGDLTA